MPSLNSYFFPPRPGGSITLGDLAYYEQSGQWLIQPKFNESRIVTHVLPTGEVVFWTRWKTRPANMDARAVSVDVMKSLQLTPGLEYWLDGGVMNKGKGGEGELVFYDILQLDKYLFMKPSQTERLSMLEEICGKPQELNAEGTAFRVSDHLWLSSCFQGGFHATLKRLLAVDYIEGVMLRKKASVLDNYGRTQYEASWMKRCRVK